MQPDNFEDFIDFGLESPDTNLVPEESSNFTYIIYVIIAIVGVVIFLWLLTYFLSEEEVAIILKEMSNNNSNLQPVKDV